MPKSKSTGQPPKPRASAKAKTTARPQSRNKTAAAKSLTDGLNQISDSLACTRAYVTAVVPGMLDSDENFRRTVIGYLLQHHRKELLASIQEHYGEFLSVLISQKGGKRQ